MQRSSPVLVEIGTNAFIVIALRTVQGTISSTAVASAIAPAVSARRQPNRATARPITTATISSTACGRTYIAAAVSAPNATSRRRDGEPSSQGRSTTTAIAASSSVTNSVSDRSGAVYSNSPGKTAMSPAATSPTRASQTRCAIRQASHTAAVPISTWSIATVFGTSVSGVCSTSQTTAATNAG
jgi:hypothetical protein